MTSLSGNRRSLCLGTVEYGGSRGRRGFVHRLMGMTSDIQLERPVRPSDMRAHRALHGRRGRLGTIADAIVAAINGFFV